MPILRCPVCAAEFRRRPSRVKKYAVLYCSMACYAQSQKEGRSSHPREWNSYRNAQRRCNGTAGSSERYVSRGIEFRFPNFETFYAELGDRPEGTEVDRIENDGHYEPGNVRWATKPEQARNRSSNRMISFGGRTQTLVDWAEEAGIRYGCLQQRLDAGWSVERALTTPVRRP